MRQTKHSKYLIGVPEASIYEVKQNMVSDL